MSLGIVRASDRSRYHDLDHDLDLDIVVASFSYHLPQSKIVRMIIVRTSDRSRSRYNDLDHDLDHLDLVVASFS